jgi:hypothetical protein
MVQLNQQLCMLCVLVFLPPSCALPQLLLPMLAAQFDAQGVADVMTVL